MNQLPILIHLKYTALRNSYLKLKKSSPFELLTLSGFLIAAGIGLFYFFLKGFFFFQSQKTLWAHAFR